MTLEKLVVIIQAQTAALEKSLARVKGQFSTLEKAADRVSNRITRSFNRSGSGLSKAFNALKLAAVTAGLAKFGQSAIDAASDLQE